MNEEIQSKLVDYLDRIEQTVEAGGDFVATEAPLFVNELLAWTFWNNVIGGFSVLTILLLPIAVAWLAIREMRRDKDFEGPGWFLLAGAFAAALMICSISCGQFQKAVKVKVAPRVVIVEQLSDLSKKVVN